MTRAWSSGPGQAKAGESGRSFNRAQLQECLCHIGSGSVLLNDGGDEVGGVDAGLAVEFEAGGIGGAADEVVDDVLGGLGAITEVEGVSVC